MKYIIIFIKMYNYYNKLCNYYNKLYNYLILNLKPMDVIDIRDAVCDA